MNLQRDGSFVVNAIYQFWVTHVLFIHSTDCLYLGLDLPQLEALNLLCLPVTRTLLRIKRQDFEYSLFVTDIFPVFLNHKYLKNRRALVEPSLVQFFVARKIMSVHQCPDSLNYLRVNCLKMCPDGFVKGGLIVVLGCGQLQAKVILRVNGKIDWGGDLDPVLDGEAAVGVQRVGLQHVFELHFLDWELLCALTVLPCFEADVCRVLFVEVDIELLVGRDTGLGLFHQAILEQLGHPKGSNRTHKHHNHRKHRNSLPQAFHSRLLLLSR